MSRQLLTLTILATIFLTTPVTAQDAAVPPGPLPCGVPLEGHQEAEALYPMPYDGKWGFVNRSGAWILDPTWARVTDFSEGRAVVAEVDGLWGVIDNAGEYILEPSLRSQSSITWENRRITDPPLKPFSEGCSAGVGGTTADAPFFVDRDGNIYWAQGRPAPLDDLDVHEFGSFSEGKAWFRVFDIDSDLTYGWTDAAGNIAIPVEYGGAGQFVGGVAPAGADRYTWGYIDEQGELVFPRKWTLEFATSYSQGLAYVSFAGGGTAYVDSEGIVFDSVKSEELLDELGGSLAIRAGGEFHDGLAPVSAGAPPDRLFAYVDREGSIAFVPDDIPGIEVCDSRARPEFRNGLVRLLVADDGEDCGGNAPFLSELASYQGASYVYLDTSGRIVLREGEIEPPVLPESGEGGQDGS